MQPHQIRPVSDGKEAMNECEPRPSDASVTLPATAPAVRLTAGVGSAGQKTWNVRRPVTLIGSKRPAHITLHDRDISNAHCVIVNTGADVLLKDLHTDTGTFCNNRRVDGIAVLKDGDVVTMGATKLQIAIRVPEDKPGDSACGVEFVEPTKLRHPVTVRLDRTEAQWRIDDAIALIGRHDDAAIRLDHQDVSARHAILLRYMDGLAIFDLGSRSGVLVNGECSAFVPLRGVRRVSVGPCALTIDSSEPVALQRERPGSDAYPTHEVPSGGTLEHGAEFRGGETSSFTYDREGETSDRRSRSVSPAGSPRAPDARSPTEALADIESDLSMLQRNIADSWNRLNAWQSRLAQDASRLTHKESDLVARETELDAKDAALRGQLHDLTRYHEQITAREQELATQLARIQGRQQELDRAQAAFAERQVEVARQADDVKRREHVLAQRWTRLMAVSCPRCGEPVNTRNPGITDPQA